MVKRSFRVYQMSSDKDYFYNHPNTVMLGFFGVVAVILLFLMSVVWIGYKISLGRSERHVPYAWLNKHHDCASGVSQCRVCSHACEA
jgi:hypothetical protein